MCFFVSAVCVCPWGMVWQMTVSCHCRLIILPWVKMGSCVPLWQLRGPGGLILCRTYGFIKWEGGREEWMKWWINEVGDRWRNNSCLCASGGLHLFLSMYYIFFSWFLYFWLFVFVQMDNISVRKKSGSSIQLSDQEWWFVTVKNMSALLSSLVVTCFPPLQHFVM